MTYVENTVLKIRPSVLAVLGQKLTPSLIFLDVGTLVGRVENSKYSGKLERLASDKHSSLFLKNKMMKKRAWITNTPVSYYLFCR